MEHGEHQVKGSKGVVWVAPLTPTMAKICTSTGFENFSRSGHLELRN